MRVDPRFARREELLEALMTDTKGSAPSLPQVLHAAIKKFDQWTRQHMESEDKRNTIDTALYHYTDARGL